MIDAGKLKPFIDYLLENNIPQKSGLKLLEKEPKLTSIEKNIIFAYCYPRPLGDMELVKRIQDYRKLRGRNIDDVKEAILILEAARTHQYEKFIKHVMISFITDPGKVVNVDKKDGVCSICDGPINNAETPHSKGYGSIASDLIICEHCMAQLFRAKNLISVFDPSFLDWTKKWSLAIKK